MGRKRLRDLGISIGEMPVGKWNAITDVRRRWIPRFCKKSRNQPGNGPARKAAFRPRLLSTWEAGNIKLS
ncbi:hypothetical protein D3876_08050 [Sphingomonas cavernae]|uniref:Uncharacterized protein n=1 Tax=Sphingomonas cavernae TaxID=2320861 RepID=A0A418WK73_9SPHN|nr:hypothetical protein D3876_08050 [Sphingomonas cavernae]